MVRIAAGELRQQIQIQANTPTNDAYNQRQDSWSTLVTRWAKIESATGSGYIQSDEVRNLATHRITIRYYADVTPRCRVLFGSRIFNIVAVLNTDERKIETIILATEVS